jgi:hypothetical protein
MTMKLGRGIRIGLVAVTLLAQFALPVAHSRGIAGALPGFSSASAPVVAAIFGADGSTVAAHDPSHCPVCFALSQARVGVVRTLPDVVLRLVSPSSAQLFDPGSALPRVPEIAAAPPRAPPIRSLSFA